MYIGLNPKFAAVFTLMTCLFFLTTPVYADSRFQTRVRVIHATKGKAHVDPGIQDIVKEIQPVFNYSRFKVLSEKNMLLNKGENGRMSLPGGRSLVISPSGMEKNRIQYHVRINAKGKPVFQTGIRLRNDSSVTIGGPRLSKGVILLNIQGRAR